jgi:hypothetical protein
MLKLLNELYGRPAELSFRAFGQGDFRKYPPNCPLTPEMFETVFPRYANQCLVTHTSHYHVFDAFIDRHTAYQAILNIRDPRDILISQAFYMKGEIPVSLKGDHKLEKRILWILRKGGVRRELENTVWDLEMNCKVSNRYYRDPSVLTIRFEDLVGEKGGGNSQKQHDLIATLSQKLNLSLSEEQYQKIEENIFGESHTFRKGKIGAWKTHFTPKIKAEFKKRLSQYLIEWGYETDNNW